MYKCTLIMTYYFLDQHPVDVMCFDRETFYLKLKQLTKCFVNVSYNNVLQKCNNMLNVIKFEQLLKKYHQFNNDKNKYTCYPSTLMIKVEDVHQFFETMRVNTNQKRAFVKFLKDILSNYDYCFMYYDNEHDDEHDLIYVNLEYGVTPNNVQFVCNSIDHDDFYFKLVDIGRLLNVINVVYWSGKYVSLHNIVSWGQLKTNICDKYVCGNVLNYWKNNTLFINQKGVKELDMKINKNSDTYKDLLENTHYTPPLYLFNTHYSNKKNKKRKQLYISNNLYKAGVTKRYNLHYVKCPNNVTYFKLHEIIKRFSIKKIHNYNIKPEHLILWKNLNTNISADHNIKWKPNLTMIDLDGVYGLLNRHTDNTTIAEILIRDTM